MTAESDFLVEIKKLEKKSKVALPFTFIGLFGVIAAIYISSESLVKMRAEVVSADILLQAKKEAIVKADDAIARANAKLAATESRLSAIQAQVEGLQLSVAKIPTASTEFNAQNQAVSAALTQAAAIDAALAVTGSELKSNKQKNSASSAYGSISVDLFFCTDSTGLNKKNATAAFNSLQNSGVGRWRVRPLPSEINAREGYKIKSNLIRHNSNETTVATQLRSDVEKNLEISMSSQEIQYPTPNYISAFFCSAK